MEKKIEHVRKLMRAIALNVFEVPHGPGSEQLVRELRERMKRPDKTIDRDFFYINLSLSNLEVIEIRVGSESHHNGDTYDRYDEKIPVFESFLDFAIGVLRNRVANFIDNEMQKEEKKQRQEKIEAHMKELGL